MSLRPAERAERPEPRREPGVEHVLVLPDLVAAARRARVRRPLRAPTRCRSRRSRRPGCGAPTRSGARCTSRGCSPSSRGRPCPALGHEARSSPLLHGLDRRLGQRLHLHEPLRARGAARPPCRSGSNGPRRAWCSSIFSSRPGSSSGLHDFLRQSKRSMPGVRPGVLVHRAVFVDHDVDMAQVVALAHLEVVRIVRRRHLHRARAELRIHEIVLDHRELAPQDRAAATVLPSRCA